MWSWLKKPNQAAPVAPSMRRYAPQADKQKQGAQAELLAQAYLSERGLKFIEANLACTQGEIDLIMSDGETLVFIEVRWRKTAAYGGAAVSITPAKLKRLSNACAVFLQQNRINSPCRIDAVLLQGELTAPEITWLKNITG